MSQMWCYLALSTILGLCCIIECSSIVPRVRGSLRAKKDGSNTSIKNNPRRDKSCYVPYRGYIPLYCDYFILIGKYTEGDKRVSNEEYSKPRSNSTPLEMEVVFPTGDAKNDLIISYIYVEDSEQSKQIWYDDLHISEGGIGEKRVKLIIKSNEHYLPKYRVAIYAREENNRVSH